MIGYRISKEDLEARIDVAVPGWRKRAAARTREFRAKRRYAERSSIWNEVKAVYMQLQGAGKCAYCERKLESVDYGKSEHDIEHFRPKKHVREWPVPKALKDRGVVTTAVPVSAPGYYLLPYHPLNFAVACKPCNSALKKDYFPIAGKYSFGGSSPVLLDKEKPLLVNPVGDFDDAPEVLIRFEGVSPQPVANRGYKRERALVMIDFFRLDDVIGRPSLIQDRARLIIALYPQLIILAGRASRTAKQQAKRIVDKLTVATSPHANCTRSFRVLFEDDRTRAGALFDAAVEQIESKS